MLDNKSLILLNNIELIYKPIVNIYTGSTSIVEILYQNRDFSSLDSEILNFEFELQVFKRAVLELKDFKSKKLKVLFKFKSNQIEPEKIYNLFAHKEISVYITLDRYLDTPEQNGSIYLLKKFGIKVGIDNFGGGFSDLKAIYKIEPDFVRVDSFFINLIDRDYKKRLITSNLVNILHTMGVKIIADSVNTKKEFYVCKDLGFDYIAGECIKHNTTLQNRYEEIKILNEKDKRKKEELQDKKLIKNEITKIDAISSDSHIIEIFNAFRKNREMTFLPVVDKSSEPLGLIREKDLKNYVYSLYGKELLLNKGLGKSLLDFVSKCSIVDVNTGIEEILEIFSNDYYSEGIIITKEAKYYGFLSAKSLIRILNEKNLNIARNQNPLTKLPGNNLITNYISDILITNEKTSLIYFDFDNFKPYNDYYGFRQGDRIILLFSELMQKHLQKYNSFLGHIGGDDFFAGIKNHTFLEVEKIIIDLNRKFKENAEDFYTQEDRERGYIISKDREGNTKEFPLLCVSAVIVHINTQKIYTIEDISTQIAKLKKVAKNSQNKIASIEIGE